MNIMTNKITDFLATALTPANRKQHPLPLPDDPDVICEGVVTFCITPQANIAFTC
jgi:hypothetical protein